MTVLFKGAAILSDKSAEFVRKDILVNDGRIEKICDPSENFFSDKYIDVSGKYLTPGFIDAHTHGRVGFDFNTADADGIARMLKSYYRRGVTGVYPTLASATLPMLLEKMRLISEFDYEQEGMAEILGVHIEGRYLNPEKKGAHLAKLLTAPDKKDVPEILDAIKGRLHVSAAYELDKDESFIAALKRGGATVGLAHTSADYETTKRLFEKYGISLTHMFNAMNPLHHRSGGAVAAALTSDMFAEIICDGIHVSPEMVSLAFKCKRSERLVLITDSMEATDFPDGEYSIAGQPVVVKDSIARTLEGALAGSTLNLETAVNNLSTFAGATIPEALMCATRNPAMMLGVYDICGSLSEGKHANIISADINDGVFRISDVYTSFDLREGRFSGRSLDE